MALVAERRAPVSALNATTMLIAQATTTSPTGIQWASRPRRRPIIAVTRNPTSGRIGMSGMRRSNTAHRRIASYSSTSGVFRLRKMAMTIASPTVASAAATAMTMMRDHRAVELERRDECAEGHDGEIDRVEHQLDRHEHGDRVAPREEPERPDREQQARQRQVRVQVIREVHLDALLALGEEDAADDGREEQHADGLEDEHVVLEQHVGDERRRGANGLRAAPQFVPNAATATRTAITIAAIAAGAACVWKTRRALPTFSWVSMIANRIRTLIAPMYTRTWAAATIGAPSVTYSPARDRKHTIIARPQRMMSRIETTAMAAASISVARLATRASSNVPPIMIRTISAGVVTIAPATAAAIR